MQRGHETGGLNGDGVSYRASRKGKLTAIEKEDTISRKLMEMVVPREKDRKGDRKQHGQN